VHCFSDDVSEAQRCTRFHSLLQLNVLIFVRLSHLVNEELHLGVHGEARKEYFVGSGLGHWNTACKGVIRHVGLSFADSSAC
jgi:hypothetical protein